jgi:micrococcal nuclease
MRFLGDRYLRFLVIIIVTLILAMFVSHRHIKKEIKPLTSKETKEKPLSIAKSLPPKGPFLIVKVIDGDTIVLENGETVRLIGIDAPELHHPEVPVQRFAKEAKEFLKGLVEGFECTLEYEPHDIRDKYGRLLAYVFVKGKLINAELIKRGYAYAYTRFPFRLRDRFIALEQEALRHQYGLWDLSLRDGRITNLINQYESLSIEGRKELDEILKKLIKKYPFKEGK